MMRQLFRIGWLWIPFVGVLPLIVPGAVAAKDIGAEPRKCPTCSKCSARSACPASQESSPTGTSISRTEGNLTERPDIPIGARPTLTYSAIYNSYNADGSRVQLDTVMGYGWTHSYNIFLFSQVGSMFRFDGDGRVTRYKLGPGGAYTAAPGYFETLVKIGAVFKLTLKDGTVYTFALIPGTPFLVVGPVYRVTAIVDRNGNTTTFTYSAGNLASVTDTYGRSLTFTYTPQKKVATVSDPAGRVTTYSYDATGRKLRPSQTPTAGRFNTATTFCTSSPTRSTGTGGRLRTRTTRTSQRLSTTATARHLLTCPIRPTGARAPPRWR